MIPKIAPDAPALNVLCEYASDVADGIISRDTAERDYRVALASDGSVDRLATAQLRAMAAE